MYCNRLHEIVDLAGLLGAIRQTNSEVVQASAALRMVQRADKKGLSIGANGNVEIRDVARFEVYSILSKALAYKGSKLDSKFFFSILPGAISGDVLKDRSRRTDSVSSFECGSPGD